MKFSTALTIAAIAASASAATVADLPKCAQTCAVSSLAGSTCEATDTACLCKDEAFTAPLTACVPKSCSTDDLQSALTVFKEICADDTSSEDADTDDSAAADASYGNVVTSSAAPSSTAPAAAHGHYETSSYTPRATAASNSTGSGNGTSYAPAPGVYPGSKPAAYTGGAEVLRAGQWMGFLALLGMVAL